MHLIQRPHYDTDHNMVTIQQIFRDDAFQRVQECHAFCDVQSETNRLRSVNDYTVLAVQKVVKRSAGHVLRKNITVNI